MAGQMDSTLRGEIVGAVSAIPDPCRKSKRDRRRAYRTRENGNISDDGFTGLLCAVLGDDSE